MATPRDDGPPDDDVRALNALGYAQELARRMGGFSSLALSLSIICILSGGVTSFHLAHDDGSMRVGAAFLQTFTTQVIQSAASILTGILIARYLGPSGQGGYALFAAVRLGTISDLAPDLNVYRAAYAAALQSIGTRLNEPACAFGGFGCHCSVIRWNDRDGRTQKQVVAKLDEVIDTVLGADC